MSSVIQTLMGMTGALGFAVLFHVRAGKLWACAFGGALSWIVYLLVLEKCGDKVLALLAATVTVGFLAEILARVLKTPVTILLVPMLVPLVPGGDLYYTTSYLVREMTAEYAESLRLVAKEAGAIAFGIILVTCCVQILQRLYDRFKKQIAVHREA